MKTHNGLMMAAGCALLLTSFSSFATIWVTSGSGGSGGTTDLFEVNLDGSIARNVGDIGENCTGLVYEPTGGLLWCTTDPGSNTPSSVFTIDPADATATLVGPHGVDQAVTDLSLSADGMTLYGWLEPGFDDLVTIDLMTGAATVVGPGPGSAGRALELEPGGLFVLFNGSSGTLLDTATGVATGETITLTGSGDMNGSARAGDGTVYAINLPSGRDGPRQLTAVDFSTGQVTDCGSMDIQFASGIATNEASARCVAAPPVPAMGPVGITLMILLAVAMGAYTVRRLA